MQLTDAVRSPSEIRSVHKNTVENAVNCYAWCSTTMLRCEQLTCWQAEQAMGEEGPQHQCQPPHWPEWHPCWALHANLLLAL